MSGVKASLEKSNNQKKNRSQTTSERLTSVVPSWGSEMQALRGGQLIGGGGNGGVIEWRGQRFRTALHTIKLSPQNSLGEPHS